MTSKHRPPLPMTTAEQDLHWMHHALTLAARAEGEGEVPVGAVLVSADGEVLGEGWNRPIISSDPTAHAEIQTLRDACARLANYRLPRDTTLYVTLEPCPMCAGAMVHARVGRLVYAATDPRAGSAGTIYNLLQSPHLNHRCEVFGGVMEAEAAEQLRSFFRLRRSR